jgi:hypothetical protein
MLGRSFHAAVQASACNGLDRAPSATKRRLWKLECVLDRTASRGAASRCKLPGHARLLPRSDSSLLWSEGPARLRVARDGVVRCFRITDCCIGGILFCPLDFAGLDVRVLPPRRRSRRRVRASLGCGRDSRSQYIRRLSRGATTAPRHGRVVVWCPRITTVTWIVHTRRADEPRMVHDHPHLGPWARCRVPATSASRSRRRRHTLS